MIESWKKISFLTFLFCFGITTSQADLNVARQSPDFQLKRAFSAFEQGDYEDAVTIWQELAEQGIASAQINLAAMYDSGQGISVDPAKAVILYRMAASNGNPFAQYNLALMYVEGRGVARNLLMAEKWLVKAAAQNLALAQYQLGLLYAGNYCSPEIDDNSPGSNQIQLSQDMSRALHLIYESGLGFEREADADGLQKTIETMVDLAPGDPRIATLQIKFDALLNNPDTKSDPSGQGTAFGTAWPLENGFVVTNYHVIAGSRELALQNAEGHQIEAWPVLYDQKNDLALLSVADASQLPPALSLSGAEASLGESVFTLGFPRVDILGPTPKYTAGIIEGDRGHTGNPDRYLTTVDIQPGNSGGPLLNVKGEVVGVVTAMIGLRDEATGIVQIQPNQSYAVKSVHVQQLIAQLPKNERYHHPKIGRGESSQGIQEQLKGSVLIVIAQGES